MPDNPQLVDGDHEFTSVNMKLDRALLETSTLALAVNKRLRFGSADTRRGCRCIAYLGVKLLGSGPMRSDKSVTTRRADDLILTQTMPVPRLMLVPDAAAVKQFDIEDGAFAADVTVPGGGTAGDLYDVVTAFDKTLLLTDNTSPVKWDGSSGTNFSYVTNSTPADTSKSTLSLATRAAMIENRLVFRLSADAIGATLINDYTRYDPVYGVFYLNPGDAGGAITAVYPTLNSVVLIFKEFNIQAITEFTGDLSGATLGTVNATLGCNAPNSITQIGGDTIFLSQTGRGVFRIGEIVQNRLQTAPLPISDPIQPMIDRINWAAATEACSAVVGEYFYLAVPIDGAQHNNAVLVYNTVTGAWEGYDTFGEAIAISRFHVLPKNGLPQLYAVDYVRGAVWLMYDATATVDYFPTNSTTNHAVNIADVIETRGYMATARRRSIMPAEADEPMISIGTQRKVFKVSHVALATNNPSTTVTAISDGALETKVLAGMPITASYSKSFLFGNNGTNPSAAKQQGYADGTLQETLVRRNVNLSGRWVSLRIANTQGRCNIRAVEVHSKIANRAIRAGA